jgi:pantothenate synthetase
VKPLLLSIVVAFAISLVLSAVLKWLLRENPNGAAAEAAETAAAAGERDAAAVGAAARAAMTSFDVEPEYLALVDPQTLAPVATIDGEVLVAIAARVDETRLIDNTTLRPSDSNGSKG